MGNQNLHKYRNFIIQSKLLPVLLLALSFCPPGIGSPVGDLYQSSHPDDINRADTTLILWTENVPGSESGKHPADTINRDRGVTRLGNVTDPLLMVFIPDKKIKNDAAVIVCPGGAYKILAIDLEGTEIAWWLNSLGFTAFVLQYRVPDQKEGVLQDIQRAIRIVRENSAELEIDPAKVGVMGFSAGGHLCAMASTLYDRKTYSPQDTADSLPSRPSFCVLIYAAYLDTGEERSLSPELEVDEHHPPGFLFATSDDHHGNGSLVYSQALRDAKVPVELHFINHGGHGYGLRSGNEAAETWPSLAGRWLKMITRNTSTERLQE